MYNDLGLLILRVSVGLTMLLGHGWPKLANFTAKSLTFSDPLGVGHQISLTLAVTTEFFCSLALIIGVATRWVSIPLLVTMLVALFLVHGADPWRNKELAAMYAICYAALMFTGGGKFSLDSIFGKKS
ncbi:MAG: DoxX family protein [Bacteriovoracaceae bacterium]|jgi:putative oxidoreductase|nr:DoxX family protein [Bacteriovoracaceae bacterium]